MTLILDERCDACDRPLMADRTKYLQCPNCDSRYCMDCAANFRGEGGRSCPRCEPPPQGGFSPRD